MPKEPLPNLLTTIRNAIFGRKMTYVHPPIPNQDSIRTARRKLASFQLRTGEWIVFAKANARGHETNTRKDEHGKDIPFEVDTQLKLIGTEGTNEKSDTGYAGPNPAMFQTISLILPIQVDGVAQFELWATTQGGGQVGISDIVVTGIREA
jgi:hypothetical protein